MLKASIAVLALLGHIDAAEIKRRQVPGVIFTDDYI